MPKGKRRARSFIFKWSQIVSLSHSRSTNNQSSVIISALNCSGECDVGGRPACYYSTPGTLEPQQYWDISGPRCVCYDGYFGHKCSHIGKIVNRKGTCIERESLDSCPQQTISETIGRMVWNETRVNGTARIACPYGPAGYTLHRRCSWDRDEERPVWEKPLAIDVEGCRKKARASHASIALTINVHSNFRTLFSHIWVCWIIMWTEQSRSWR